MESGRNVKFSTHAAEIVGYLNENQLASLPHATHTNQFQMEKTFNGKGKNFETFRTSLCS